MRTKFHQKTLRLLGDEFPSKRRSTAKLLKWAKKNAITVPPAFLEWAELDDGSLLQKYSNDDWFWFDDPEIVETPEGTRGLRFNSENQNNYDRIVTLDQGDDPPVLFGWLGRAPWVTHTQRFSEAVFAQVFDWQYWLEFKPDDPTYKEITYTGDIRVKSDACLSVLRRRYEELASTKFVVEGDVSAEYRFVKSPTLRLTVCVEANRSTDIRITGRPMKAVKQWKAELRSLLPSDSAAKQPGNK
jgi:hypothetical protein